MLRKQTFRSKKVFGDWLCNHLIASPAEIQHKRDTGKMLYVKRPESEDIFEYYEYDSSSYAVVMRSSDIDVVNFVILVDKPILETLIKHRPPKFCAYIFSRSGCYSLFVSCNLIGDRKRTCFNQILFQYDKRVYHIDSPFDFRFKNLTTTDVYDLVGWGMVGVRSTKFGATYRRTVDKTRRWYNAISITVAQQLYNKHLFNLKKKGPNFDMFGFYFDQGVMQCPFPEEFFDNNGFLKDEYERLLKKHAHLFPAVTDEVTLMEIKKQGDACMEGQMPWIEQLGVYESFKRKIFAS